MYHEYSSKNVLATIQGLEDGKIKVYVQEVKYCVENSSVIDAPFVFNYINKGV